MLREDSGGCGQATASGGAPWERILFFPCTVDSGGLTVDMHSVKSVDKKEGSGKGNWGKAGEEAEASPGAIDPKGEPWPGVAEAGNSQTRFHRSQL